MSQMSGDTLLDIELEPDTANELGPTDDVEVLRDDEVKGCRLLLVRRKVQSLELGHGRFGAIEIDCSLQSVRGLRFTYAQVIVRLEEPANVVFIDIAPVQVTESATVQYAYQFEGKIFEFADIGLGGVHARSERTVSYEHRQVQGTGGGTSRADWRFTEDANAKQGIGTTQALFMTVPVVGRIKGKVGLNAKIERSGTAAGIRNMLLGKSMSERWHVFEVDIPQS